MNAAIKIEKKESEKKTRYLYFLYKPTKKRKRFHILNCHVTMTKKRRNLFLWKCHVTMPKKNADISNEMEFQRQSLALIHKNESLLSATSILYCSLMAYNTTASLDKLSCTDYVDLDKCQD